MAHPYRYFKHHYQPKTSLLNLQLPFDIGELNNFFYSTVLLKVLVSG